MQNWRALFIPFFLLGIFFLSTSSSAETQKEKNKKLFLEIQNIVSNNFYKANFDFKSLYKRHQEKILNANSDKEFAQQINVMLADLQISHCSFFMPQDREYYELLNLFMSIPMVREKYRAQLDKMFPSDNSAPNVSIDKKISYYGIGIYTQQISDKIFIQAVLNGSPAERAGLTRGMQILAVDGKPFEPITSFTGKEKALLKMQTSTEINSQKEIFGAVEKISSNDMFYSAMKNSAKIFSVPNSQNSKNKKIAYVHLWSYAGEQYHELLQELILFSKLAVADALILDLRFGWGGANPEYLNIFNKNIPVLTNVSRDKTTSVYQPFWSKPVVLLIDESVRSGKEIFAYAVQKYKIGKLVGTKTQGAVSGGQPFLLQDGSFLMLASMQVYVDGKSFEGKGVDPDIKIENPLPYAKEDLPLQKALEILGEE